MFTYVQDAVLYALTTYTLNPSSRALPRDFWGTIALEWLVIQTLFLYTFNKLISHKNYFRQILALMWLLCVLSVYIAFMQIELFACFMFVAEFTIVIFFYALFLHLRVSTVQSDTTNESAGYRAPAALFLVFFATWGGSRLADGEISLVFAELYNRASYVALSDLTFFASTVMRTNLVIHYMVGLLLLFLTLFLFFTVNVYYFLNITRREAARTSTSKLAAGRGYYEQTAEEVQKVISTSHQKK